MKIKQIELTWDLSFLSLIDGDTKDLSGRKSEDLRSLIEMRLPDSCRALPVGEYVVDYKGNKVHLQVSTINTKADDEILHFLSRLIMDPLDLIPREAFTDNRGQYPAISVKMIFPGRIASWIDDTQENGVKEYVNDERMQVIGGPDNEEQILAMIILNSLINTQSITGLNCIKYDDVSMFLEAYYPKSIYEPVLVKFNAFTSRDAYRNAVYDYILPNLYESDVGTSIQQFQRKNSARQINSEDDLKLTVEEMIQNVLKHNIEARYWIEPFWDGQKKIIHNNEEILIPRSPKGETKIQPTLHVILDMALSPLGIHVIRESNEGVGSIDFKFLFTTTSRVPLSIGAEFKVAHHKEIKKGVKKQLPAYLRAINSSSGIFVIMWFKDDIYFKEPKGYEKNKMEEWVVEEASRTSSELGIHLSAAMIDASIRPSASNLE